MTAEFIHLNVHTEFSLAESIVRIPALMDTLCQQAQDAQNKTPAASEDSSGLAAREDPSGLAAEATTAQTLSIDAIHNINLVRTIFSLAFITIPFTPFLRSIAACVQANK